MILIELPDSALAERGYILEILLQRWLGVEFRTQVVDGAQDSVVIHGERGFLLVPDIFLQTAEGDWCNEQSLPKASSYRLRKDVPEEWARQVGEQDLPVLFEREEAPLLLCKESGDKIEIQLGFDLIGTAFFFLSRYEEVVAESEHDEHDRFLAQNSCAGKAGLLGRPVVNEYLEILWLVLQALEPGLIRRERSFEVVPTHDVDRPFRYRGVSVGRMAQICLGQLRAGRGVKSVFNLGLGWVTNRVGAVDPYFTFPWILEASKERGVRSTFYIQCTQSQHAQDDNFDYLSPEIVSFVGEAVADGHPVGVHPGYGTFRSAEVLGAEVDRFRELWRRADCGDLQELRSRQHYLRWDHSVTPGLLDSVGVKNDSSLGFADAPGFRCGCCYEYPLYDVCNRKSLGLIEKPLILMECTLIDERYMGLGVGEESLTLARQAWDKCRHFGGQFVFLWHNHRLVKKEERALYELILGMEQAP